MADLKDFYPAPTQASPRGDGSPASPATVTRGGGAIAPSGTASSHVQNPAIWVLIIAGVSFLLLHNA